MRPNFWSTSGTWITLILAAFLAAVAGYLVLVTAKAGVPPAAFRVGYSPEPPFSFRGSGGRASGEAPEVARAILSRLGIGRVDWVQTDFGLLIPELLAGRIDMIAAGMFVTPDRERLVAFSKPTLALSQSLLVIEGNPKRIHRYEDFAEREELKLGVLAGAIERAMALELRVPERRIVVLPDAQTGVIALSSGAVDGFALSGPSIRRLRDSFAKSHLEVPSPFYEPVLHGTPARSFSAFAFRPADTALRMRLDAELDRFVGTAGHLALIGRFGFGASDLPQSVFAVAPPPNHEIEP